MAISEEETETLEEKIKKIEDQIKLLETDVGVTRIIITSLMKQLKEMATVQNVIAGQISSLTTAIASIMDSKIDYEYLGFEDDGTYN